MTKEKEKKEHNYCIPSPLASLMNKIDDRTQMEASLLSMSMLLVGLMFFTVYMGFFSNMSLIAKIMTIFNGLCGFIFLFSYLVTTFNQYQALMETQEIIGSFGTDEPFPTGSSPNKSFPKTSTQINPITEITNKVPSNSNLKQMKGGLD